MMAGITASSSSARALRIISSAVLAKGTRSNPAAFTGGATMLPPNESPKLSEIGITKRQPESACLACHAETTTSNHSGGCPSTSGSVPCE